MSREFELIPLRYKTAAAFVKLWHRHHDAPVGHIVSLGAVHDGTLVGVAMLGRPVAATFDDGRTLEVNRTATTGERNCNSFLYGAARRAAVALGYERLITYTQEGESGASLRAAGYTVTALRPARSGWNAPSRPREDHGADRVARTLWDGLGEFR